MPDPYRFDQFPDGRVRCVDCGAGGPRWKWPDQARRDHATEHEIVGTVHLDERAAREQLEARRATWRSYKRRCRARKFAPRECENPECESPFTPSRAGQKFCQDSCRDRAAYA